MFPSLSRRSAPNNPSAFKSSLGACAFLTAASPPFVIKNAVLRTSVTVAKNSSLVLLISAAALGRPRVRVHAAPGRGETPASRPPGDWSRTLERVWPSGRSEYCITAVASWERRERHLC